MGNVEFKTIEELAAAVLGEVRRSPNLREKLREIVKEVNEGLRGQYSFESRLAVGSFVQVRWREGRRPFIDRGRINRINERSYRVELIDAVAGESSFITVPKVTSTGRWSRVARSLGAEEQRAPSAPLPKERISQ